MEKRVSPKGYLLTSELQEAESQERQTFEQLFEEAIRVSSDEEIFLSGDLKVAF